MSSKGEALNKRIWHLFEKAGFATKPNSNDPNEETVLLSSNKKRTLDLSASDKALGVKIIGWNKSVKKLNESHTIHLHDYDVLKKKVKANSVLFVLCEDEATEETKAYAESLGMRIWGEQEIKYYEALVDAIGEYARYEIIHSFGIKTTEERNIHNVLALRYSQPYRDSTNEIFLFTISPEILLKTCTVFRKAQGSGDAYQRMVKKNRLSSVKNFVTQEEAFLPTNLIVHFNDQVTWDDIDVPDRFVDGKRITISKPNNYDLVLLRIPMEYASLELIDGQHRLYGFVNTEILTKNNFNLVVTGVKLSSEKRRSTFVAINDNSRRMDPNLVAYLKYTQEEAECQQNSELMAIKIVVELNNLKPFKDKIRLLDMGDQKITLKGFSGYDLKGLVGSKGLLKKYCGTDSNSYKQVLRLYFSIAKTLFEKQWNDPRKYIIFTNRGISAFLKLLKSILKTTKHQITEDDVNKYLGSLKKRYKDKDWEIKHLENSYVGAQGWRNFHRDLVKTIQKDYPELKG